MATFVLALVVVPFLPLYLERTLMRSWRVDRAGDQIDWGLEAYFSHQLLVELQLHGP